LETLEVRDQGQAQLERYPPSGMKKIYPPS
jgi:hypothetical protein